MLHPELTEEPMTEEPMTEERMALIELQQKSGDGDFLRAVCCNNRLAAGFVPVCDARDGGLLHLACLPIQNAAPSRLPRYKERNLFRLGSFSG